MGGMTRRRAWGLLAPVVPLIGAVIAAVITYQDRTYHYRFVRDSEKAMMSTP